VVFDSLSAMLHELSDQPYLAKERTDQIVRLTKGMGGDGADDLRGARREPAGEHLRR